jgi:hypothetical protein
VNNPARQIRAVRGRGPIVAIALLVCGCASSAKVPSPPSLAAANGTGPIDESDVAYDKMAVAAASRIKFIAPGKIVGVYQTNSKSTTLRGMVNTVIEEYGYTEVHPGETDFQCGKTSRQTVVSSVANCKFDVADVLVQFNSVQMTRDSGYVGGLLTDVPRGEKRTRTTAFCFVAARHGADWVGVQNTVVDAPRDCASDRKH